MPSRTPSRRRGRTIAAVAAGVAVATVSIALACSKPDLSPSVREAKAEIEDLRDAIVQYVADAQGRAPAQLAELLPAEGDTGYVSSEDLLRDPWDRPYVYEPPADAEPYNIRCLGKDGLEGGTGEDADIDLNMIRDRRI